MAGSSYLDLSYLKNRWRTMFGSRFLRYQQAGGPTRKESGVKIRTSNLFLSLILPKAPSHTTNGSKVFLQTRFGVFPMAVARFNLLFFSAVPYWERRHFQQKRDLSLTTSLRRIANDSSTSRNQALHPPRPMLNLHLPQPLLPKPR